MLLQLSLIRHIRLEELDMYPDDIDKQMNHFRERKDSYRVDIHPENDMDQLIIKLILNEKYNDCNTHDVRNGFRFDRMDIDIDKNH